MALDPEFFPPQVEEVEQEEEAKKENLLFTFVDSIHYKKNNMLDGIERDSDLMEKEFKRLTFVVNRSLSMFVDTVTHAQEMNERSFLDGKMQYLYLLHAVSKKKRFPPKGSKWFTKNIVDNMEVVKEYYGYSTKKALSALDILTEKDIEYIKDRLRTGGIEKGKSSKKKKA